MAECYMRRVHQVFHQEVPTVWEICRQQGSVAKHTHSLKVYTLLRSSMCSSSDLGSDITRVKPDPLIMCSQSVSAWRMQRARWTVP